MLCTMAPIPILQPPEKFACRDGNENVTLLAGQGLENVNEEKKLTVPSENAVYLANAAEALAVVKWEGLVTKQRGELRVPQSASCGLRGHSQGNE